MLTGGPRRRLGRALAAAGALAVALAVVVVLLVLHSPGNVSHANVPPAPAHKRATAPAPASDFQWPLYGYDAARTRFFASTQLAPPFRVGWRFDAGALLEFPPVIYGNTLYFIDFDGAVRAVDALTGRLLWQRKVGTLAAASPALDVHDRLLFVPLLSTEPGANAPGDGSFVALSMDTGRVVWERALPAGSESSPLVYGDSVVFGDQSGTVYSLRTYDGQLNWSYQAGGAVKGGIALADGNLYFGDYGGTVYALRAGDGQPVWTAGIGSGDFYSTPAVAFGHVFIGNTDGSVYSLAQASGQVAWATETGAYVYSSPAVADVPGLGPTVYLGSYDGDFYALDAQSGSIRWSHPAGGRISGSATIVAGVVYYSDLGTNTTAGLDARTGRQVFSFPDGEFSPVVCDEDALFLVGYSTIYQLLPQR